MSIFRSLLYLLVLVLLLDVFDAHAACTSGACVSSGPRLASMSTREATIYNSTLSQLTDSNVSLGVADWNALAQGGTNMAIFLDALAAEMGVAGRDQALAGSASMSQIVGAMATAARQEGNATLAASLDALQSQVSGLTGTLQVGDLVDTGGQSGAMDTVSTGTLDLVTGLVQLYNFDNASASRQPILLTGDSLGLGDTVQTVRLSVQTTEPPVLRCGPAGTTFHSAAMRFKLDIDLAAPTPIAVPAIPGAEMTLSSLTLYGETARGSGVITTVDAINRSVTVQATPGVADLYLGSIADSLFYDRSHRIDPVFDLDFAPVGDLRITDPLTSVVTTTSVETRSYASGQAPTTSSLVFNGPFPQTQTATTGSAFAANMAVDLANNMQVRTNPSLGATDDQVRTAIAPIVQDNLAPVLQTLTTQVMDSAFKQFGIGFGEMDVTVDGVTSACSISGWVYNDANHDGVKNSSETSTGHTHYAKLLSAQQPTGPALQVAAVDIANGAYIFSVVSAGNYIVVINRDADTSSVTPAAPTGWIPTEPRPMQRNTIAMSTSEINNQNFGIYSGSRLTGSVFRDTGSGGGIANNGLRESGEAALAGTAVQIVDTTGNNVFAAVVTAADGIYTFWIPSTVGNVQLNVQEINQSGFLSTGGDIGTTNGSYARLTDTVSFTHIVGSNYSGVDFGDVPVSRFYTDGQQTAIPGSVLFYPHTFIAGSRGKLTVSVAESLPSPDMVGWNTVLYRDSNCNNTLEAGETLLSEDVALAPDEKLCLLAKVFVPASAPINASHRLTLDATFNYDNALPVFATQLSRQDLTAVGEAATLRLIKTVDKASVNPDETITYTIAFRNDGSSSLYNLRIHDAPPAYTVLMAAACGTTPPGVTCTITTVNGSPEWQLDGGIAPGAEGNVIFVVRVE
jgi:uncharacterized repeat protein (TIGR01451 family)